MLFLNNLQCVYIYIYIYIHTHIYFLNFYAKITLKSREVRWLAGVFIANKQQRQCLSSGRSVFKPIFSPSCPLIKTIAKNYNKHLPCLPTYIISFLKGNTISYSLLNYLYLVQCLAHEHEQEALKKCLTDELTISTT